MSIYSIIITLYKGTYQDTCNEKKRDEFMIEHKEHFHGSDLEVIEKIYGIKKENITSFSANVNPLGVSPLLKQTLANNIDAITSYPDREYTSVRQAIAAYINNSADNITVGNGSTELISITMQLTKPKHAILFAPSYSEYEHELTKAGGSYEYFYMKEENDFVPDLEAFDKVISDNIDLVVICNPNNPTSYAMDQTMMRHILKKCKEHSALVMVDETYAEFAPDTNIECIPLTSEFSNLLILRGISKFFAAPGLRLGYAITSNKQLLDDINSLKNPWTINSLASIAGEIMFSDTEYITKTRELINKERRKMYQAICEIPNLKAYKPYGNFMLVKILSDTFSANDIFDAAIKKGLLIRNCETFESLDDHFFRFCFMSPEKNDELLEVIRCIALTQD